jgi:hypothetical protein
MRYVYVKRLSDGAVMDIPETHLEETLKRGFELASIVKINEAPPQPIEYECPICDKKFKTEQGLRVHKSVHK